MIKRIYAKVALNGFKLFILGVVLLVVFLPGFTKFQDLKQKNESLGAKIRELKAKNLALEQEQQRLQTDSTYLEAEARQKLGVVRKGEVVYRIAPEDASE